MPDPNGNNDSFSAADIDVAVYLEARNQEFLYNSLPTIFYIGFLSVMGLVGNSIVFMVYYKRYHASSAMRSYILVMSVTDLLTNAQILPAEVLEMRFYNTFRWVWACRIFRQTRSFLVGFSTLLLVAVAVDRQQAVCKLQMVSKQATYKRLYFPVGSCLVWALLLSLPYGIITGHRTEEFADNFNITGVSCNISDDFAGTKILLIYHLVLFLTFLILVCIIGVSYGRILLYLWRHRKKLERWQVKVKANAKQPKKDVPEPEPVSISFQSSVTVDWNRVSETVPDSSAQPLPPRVAVTSNDVATIPNDVATIPNNVATILNDVANQWAIVFNEVAKPTIRSRIEKGQTMMFAVLTLVFVVSNMPYLTVVILDELRPGLVEAALTTNGRMILIRSFYINSAVNPIVYSFCSPRFRFECRQFFARCPLVGSFLAIRD